jgi:hypothetical protein
MKYFNLLFLIALSNLSVEQKVRGVFNFPVFMENFEYINPIWDQKYHTSVLFRTRENNDLAKLGAGQKYSVVFHQIDPPIKTFRLSRGLCITKEANP